MCCGSEGWHLTMPDSGPGGRYISLMYELKFQRSIAAILLRDGDLTLITSLLLTVGYKTLVHEILYTEESISYLDIGADLFSAPSL
jgi:hypothetical protein